MNDFDLVTDRRNLRILLAFVSGSARELRIDTEVVGKTVLFYCWAEGWRGVRYADGTPSSGYGMTFKRFTKYPKQYLKTIRHHRIIKYTLGGIRLLVRCEVDGRLRPPNPTSMDVRHTHITPTGLRVSLVGSLAPSESIVHLKSCPTKKPVGVKTNENLAQLWFSMTPILIGGFYEGQGHFTTLKETNVMEDGSLDRWEAKNKEKLQKLIKLIELIIGQLTAYPARKALIVRKGSSEIEFHRILQQNPFTLPPDIRERWLS